MVFASIVYLTLIFVSMITSTVVYHLPVEINGAVGVGLVSIVLYLIYFCIFLFFTKKQGHSLRPREMLAHYHIKKVAPKDAMIASTIGLVCIITFVLLQTWSVGVFSRLGYNEPEFNMLMNNFGEYLLLVFALAVLPGIIEELLFRGLIQRGFMGFGAVTAMFMSAVLFSLFHLSPAQTVYQFFFGLILAWVYFRTKNLTIPIILHFINNFLIITYEYITQSFGYELNLDTITGGALAMLAVSMMTLLLVGGVVIWKMVSLLPAVTECDGKMKVDEQHRFWSMSNIGFFVCVVVSMALWVVVFMG